MDPQASSTAVSVRAWTYEGVKLRINDLLEPAAQGDRASQIVDFALLSLIALNIVAMVLSSVKAIDLHFHAGFLAFEAFSVVVFTLEYALRIWSATVNPRYSGRFGRLRFARSPMAVIDLLAVLPFWLAFLGLDLRALRILRLFRVFRVAKLARYSVAMQVLGEVAYSRRAELGIAGALGAMLLLLTSTFMYFIEGEAQPDVFTSIPAATWWAIATLTTVGYGDIVPATTAGRFLAAMTAVLGIAMFALPTGILGAAFTEELQQRRNREASEKCPTCGK
jgi:voltage-gated potassium channel